MPLKTLSYLVPKEISDLEILIFFDLQEAVIRVMKNIRKNDLYENI